MWNLHTCYRGFSEFVTDWVTDTGIVFAGQIRERERERERSNQAVTGFYAEKQRKRDIIFNNNIALALFYNCTIIYMITVYFIM